VYVVSSFPLHPPAEFATIIPVFFFTSGSIPHFFPFHHSCRHHSVVFHFYRSEKRWQLFSQNLPPLT
jgi:hypothetical protein